MNTKTKSAIARRNVCSIKNIVTIIILSGFFSCQKIASVPQAALQTGSSQPEINNSPAQLHASASRLLLLQENADKIALSLHWAAFPCNVTEIQDYSVEASMAGAQFDKWIELGSTPGMSIDFTNQEFNKQIRQLFVTGFVEDIVIRIKCNREGLQPLYSYGVPLEVTTYQPTIDYDDSYAFRIPGNFQNWNPGSAPRIVSPALNGEYEGYINFTNNYPQFLMLKNSGHWSTPNTYYNIGDNKFGFGGNIFSLKEGAGIYKLNANTNCNTWSCTKINSWSVMGTAITDDGNTDVAMISNTANISWEIRGEFKAGSFVFRANKSNAIVFGHNENSETGVPDYNGSEITIAKAGNYFIQLSLSLAGNYSYSIQRD